MSAQTTTHAHRAPIGHSHARRDALGPGPCAKLRSRARTSSASAARSIRWSGGKKLRNGLRAAKRAGAHHFVISGDLTEMGTKAQYEVLAETLHESDVEPWRITLVPGNHDAYDSPTAWRDAIDGVLRPWAPTSARNPGAVVNIGSVCILPVNVACHQPVTRSAGHIDDAAVDALERRVSDPAFRHKPIAHRPAPPAVRAVQRHAVDRRAAWLGPFDAPYRALPGRPHASTGTCTTW